MSNSDDYLLVVAIDFGTTYSGYAFSMRSEPSEIHANQAWSSGGKNLTSLKTATSLLLDENGKFESFGFDAENKYVNYMIDNKHKSRYFFHRFKMKLYNNKELKRDIMIQDISGKEFPALKVFSMSIKALKDHLISTLNKEGTGIEEKEIRWVLTVPAIWDDSAKQFMRLAAKQAGIRMDRLRIALEPEAASICCQYLPTEKKEKGFSMSGVGTKYMVIDLGGGTADITLHEKLAENKLRELHKSTGGACGGTSVDEQFFQLLAKILGGPVIRSLHKKNTMAYFDLLREFESVKRTVHPDTEGKVNLTIPFVSLNELCKENDDDLMTLVKDSPLSSDVTITGDKLRVNAELMKRMFLKSADEIVSHIRGIMDKNKDLHISRFLMVGGFSESPMIQHAIRTSFPDVRLIIPNEPGLAVLKGAVIFGHQPETIASRIMKYSYGVRTTPDFDRKKHRADKLFKENETYRCADVFSGFLKAGTSVPVGHKCVHAYSTTRPFQDSMPVIIYHSTDPSPEYVTDAGCQKLGVLDVTIPDPSADEHKVAVQYVFGDTELKVVAIEVPSLAPCVANFDLI